MNFRALKCRYQVYNVFNVFVKFQVFIRCTEAEVTGLFLSERCRRYRIAFAFNVVFDGIVSTIIDVLSAVVTIWNLLATS